MLTECLQSDVLLGPALCPVNTIHSPKSSIFKNHFTNNLPSTLGSSKRPLSGRFPHQQPVCIFLSALCSTRHTERICDMVNLNDIW